MSDDDDAAARIEPWHIDAATSRVRFDGVDWPYIDTGGSGPPLIMLPGSVGTCEMFFKQIASLSSAFRIISVSYPAEPDPVQLADGLAGLMDRLALKTASILGSSFGGYWAQFFALRHVERVDHLFLGNIFIAPDELFANPLFAPELVRASTAQSLQAMWRERVAKAADGELKRIQTYMLSGRQSADKPESAVSRRDRCKALPIAVVAERADRRDRLLRRPNHFANNGAGSVCSLPGCRNQYAAIRWALSAHPQSGKLGAVARIW